MRQDAQKQSQKFCRSKEDKNGETHPVWAEKGETGCVLGAGEDGGGWGRVRADSPTGEKQAPGLVVAATAEGLASVSNETMLARTPPKGGPVSPLLAKNVPPALARPSARGFGVDVGEHTGERGKAGVTRILPQAPERPVLVWCCGPEIPPFS